MQTRAAAVAGPCLRAAFLTTALQLPLPPVLPPFRLHGGMVHGAQRGGLDRLPVSNIVEANSTSTYHITLRTLRHKEPPPHTAAAALCFFSLTQIMRARKKEEKILLGYIRKSEGKDCARSYVHPHVLLLPLLPTPP